jgi:hypothetical protein
VVRGRAGHGGSGGRGGGWNVRKAVAALEADVVVDMICLTLDSAAALVEALRERSGHLIHCGTTWRYGPSHDQLEVANRLVI